MNNFLVGRFPGMIMLLLVPLSVMDCQEYGMVQWAYNKFSVRTVTLHPFYLLQLCFLPNVKMCQLRIVHSKTWLLAPLRETFPGRNSSSPGWPAVMTIFVFSRLLSHTMPKKHPQPSERIGPFSTWDTLASPSISTQA